MAPSTGSSSQIAYTQGLEAYRAASYETSVDLFTQAIRLEPSNPKYYDARASAHEKLGQLQDALLDARDVIKLVPTSSKGYLRAGKLLKRAKKYANAETLVSQGIARVSKKDAKGIAELERELVLLQDLRKTAEFCPFSNLPLEIFVEIISLATLPPPTNRYTMTELPRAPPQLRRNNLVTLMRVSKTWARIVKGSPRLWQTLRLDGIINARNVEKKTRVYLQRALGQDEESNGVRNIGRSHVKHRHLETGTTARGIQRVIFTAAQDIPSPTFTSILDQFLSAGITSTLREVVLSFVDGSLTTTSNQRESSIATELLVFLHTYSRDNLVSLSICTGGRCYPAFDLKKIYLEFPNLESFQIWGNTTSNFVSNVRAPFLHATTTSSSSNDFDSAETTLEEEDDETPTLPTPTNARSLTVTGSVLVSDSTCLPTSFPHLTSLTLDLIGGSIIWPLLSCPNLERFHSVIYGETQILELPLPDFAASWAKIKDLRIGGAKYLPSRFLNHAITLNLKFEHLVSLDLSFSSLSTRDLSLFDSKLQAPLLKDLNLASTTTVYTDSTLVLPQLDSLESLNVSHTLWTNDETVRSLVRKCPKLEELSVVGNAFITGRPVMELVLARKPTRGEKEEEGGGSGTRLLSEMKDLRLEGCDKLETAAVEWLRKNTRPGVVKFQFLDPIERRKTRW